MRKHILVALLVCPLAFAAQAQGAGQGPGPGMGAGPGRGGPAKAMDGKGRGDPARMERRMRLVRTLGLAEALDLDEAQALKLGQQLSQLDARRLAAHQQLRDARQTLRRAASGEKASAADVDQAIKRTLDAGAQLQALDRDVVNAVTKDLSPEKRARAVLFLSRFQDRFGPGAGMGKGHGKGMMHGRGMGMGAGHGQGGMDGGACPHCAGADLDEDE